jgi:hypothetical protein
LSLQQGFFSGSSGFPDPGDRFSLPIQTVGLSKKYSRLLADSRQPIAAQIGFRPLTPVVITGSKPLPPQWGVPEAAACKSSPAPSTDPREETHARLHFIVRLGPQPPIIE